MSITWDNLASLQGGPEVVLDSLIAEIIPNSSLHLGEPEQDLLVGKTVKWPSKTVQSSGEGQHGGTESRSDQVGCVGTDVTTLVVSVDSEVKSHQLNEILVLSETKLVGKVETVIFILLDWGNLSALEYVLVDSGGNSWELGNQVHRVLKGVSPVFRLLHSLSISFGESRFMLEGIDCDGELCHWVEIAWASVDELLDEFWNIGTGGPFCGEIANLLLTWDLAGEEKPEKTYDGLERLWLYPSGIICTFWKRLLSSGGFWKKLLALWDCLSSESDTLLGVEN